MGRQDRSDSLLLGYRLNVQDLFDPMTGFLPGASIEGVGLQLRVDEDDGLVHESLGLVNIRMLAPPGDSVKPVSRFVHARLGQAPVAKSELGLGGVVQGRQGMSWLVDHLFS